MRRFLCIALLMVLIAAPAPARKTGDLMEMETEQLFVLSLEELLDREISSAGKMVEKVGDIPASAHIVSREEIETHGYRTLSEATRMDTTNEKNLRSFQAQRLPELPK